MKNKLLASVSALALIVAGCGTGTRDENQMDNNTTEVVIINDTDNVVSNDN